MNKPKLHIRIDEDLALRLRSRLIMQNLMRTNPDAADDAAAFADAVDDARKPKMVNL